MALRRRFVVCLSHDNHAKNGGSLTKFIGAFLVVVLLAGFYNTTETNATTITDYYLSVEKPLTWLWITYVNSEVVPEMELKIASSLMVAAVLQAILFYQLRNNHRNAYKGMGDVRHPNSLLAGVTVYPALGVQLSKELGCLNSAASDSQNQAIPPTNNDTGTTVLSRQFLPRDQIVDCIVYEVILSYKVKSMVAFRIKPAQQTVLQNDNQHDSPQDEGTKNDAQGEIQRLYKEEQLQLVPAFPGAELTYEECLFMRRKILLALGSCFDR